MDQLISAIQSKARNNKELSIIALLTMMMQFMLSQNQSKNISEEVAKLKADFTDVKLEHEKHFVKKEDFTALTHKIDRVNERVAEIQGYLKKASRYQASSPVCYPYTQSNLLMRTPIDAQLHPRVKWLR